MFTGLVEETGLIADIRNRGSEISLLVRAQLILTDLKIGDSVNINGACQTVVKIEGDTLHFDTVQETLSKTTLGSFKKGERVNLERALRADSRLGGHFVLGHVDTTGKVIEVVKLSGSYNLKISFNSKFDKYVIPVGSICIDGVSLTVAEKGSGWLKAAIIPHTWENTTLAKLKVNSGVNLEFDVLGKYILNLVGGSNYGGISIDKLKESGFA